MYNCAGLHFGGGEGWRTRGNIKWSRVPEHLQTGTLPTGNCLRGSVRAFLVPRHTPVLLTQVQVAFVFTILPFPITEHSLLRQNAGGALYLLANYYSVVHESIQARIRDVEGDPNDKKSLGARLTKIRMKVFTKQMLMLTNLRTHSGFQKFEIPIGGRFPKQQYDVLIESISRYVSANTRGQQHLSIDI